tara:strand:- start:1725 stop:1913 length:189 start_codon:yes stop_codon:yes gene_type:complete
VGIPNGMPKTTVVSKEEEYHRRPERIDEKTPSTFFPLSSRLSLGHLVDKDRIVEYIEKRGFK